MTNIQQKALALGLAVLSEVVTNLLKPSQSEVTDEMVERAVDAFYSGPPGQGRCLKGPMRAALEAALKEPISN